MKPIPDELRQHAGLDPSGDVYSIYSIYGDSRKLPAAPPFPVDAMPAATRSLIREASESIGCPPEFIALPMLSVIGSAIGNSRVVELKAGWEEKAVIFATVVGDPAAKKSPAAKVATKPVKDVQKDQRNAYTLQREAYDAEMRDPEIKQRIKNGEAGPKEPVMVRTVVDDTTVEALCRIQQDSPRGVLVARDELAGWLRGMDQYKAGGKGSDRQFWLSAWNSDPITVDRKGEPEALMVGEPFVGITGAIQPEVLEDLSKGPEDGMLDRFLVAYPDPVAPGWREAEISAASRRRYSDLYQQMHLKHMDIDDHGDPVPLPVTFSGGAKAVLIDVINGHAEESNSIGFPPSLKGVYGKLEAYIGRLCLVLAMARVVEERAPERVEAQDVVAVAALIRYFKAHARRVHSVIREANPLDSLAEDLAKLLQARGGEWTGTATELYLQMGDGYKATRPEDFSKMVRGAVKRHSFLSLEDAGHKRVVKDDGSATTQRSLKLKLIETL